jgi:cytochrome c oxidase assembly factor CtaG
MLPPFGWRAVLTQWQPAPAVAVSVAALAVLYLWGVARVARQHPARPWPRWRTGVFLAGLAVVIVALQSGIGSYDDVLFWDHMVQHLLLIMVAPPLLIIGQPITLLLHASRNPLHTWVKRAVRSTVASFLTWPVFGFAAYAATIVALHLTSLANLITRNQVAHDAEHVIFLVVGYLFFLPIIGSEPVRWRLSYPTKLILLFLIMPVDTFTGLVLGYGNRGTPGLPAGARPRWAESATADLHAGGAAMWVAGDALMFAMMMVVFWMWSTDSRTETRSRGWLETARRATVAPSASSPDADIDDDDAQLAAYNEYLSRLNQAEPGRARPRSSAPPPT